VGVVSPTFRREGLPGPLILPHLQEAGAGVYAGIRVGGAPSDVHFALHQCCQGEGGRRGVAGHGEGPRCQIVARLLTWMVASALEPRRGEKDERRESLSCASRLSCPS
jgi:hypothetical protein